MSDVPAFASVLKVFWDEPAALGRPTAFPTTTADDAALRDALSNAPADSRLYVSGTHTDPGGIATSALSALDHGAWIDALLDVLERLPADDGPERRRWSTADGALAPDLHATPLPRWSRALARLTDTDVGGFDALRGLVDETRRATGSAALHRPCLHALLDAGAVVLVPEPVADGLDLSVYAPVPLRDRLRAAFATRRVPGVQRFLAPYRTTRSEARFHFDRWTPDLPLPDGIEAV